MPDLLVIVVNYRTPDLVVDCLESLVPQLRAHPSAAAVVVDNASPDDSASYLQDILPKRGWTDCVTLDRAPENGGFGYGNNRGLRPGLEPGGPERFFSLNPDTRLSPGSLAVLDTYLLENPNVACLGPQIVSERGVVQNSAFRFPSVRREFAAAVGLGVVERLFPKQMIVVDHTIQEPQTVDWVSGAAMFARRSLFETVGLFDEEFFLYFEEVDLLKRAAKSGLRCVYLPTAKVTHLAGGATNVSVSDESTQREGRRPEYWFDSRRRYFDKHLGASRALAADLAFAVGHGQWWLRQKLLRRPVRTPPNFLRDLLGHRLRR